MSIRYKLFAVFCIVIALACGLAFYGIRGISSSGDLVVRLYDGPLMGTSYARSAHGATNGARLLVLRSLSEGASKETAAKFEKLIAGIWDDLKIVRERIDSKDVTAALDLAEGRLRDQCAGDAVCNGVHSFFLNGPCPVSREVPYDDAATIICSFKAL